MRDTEQAHAAVAAAQGGDRAAFAGLVEPHRRELQLHCYRMLGSFEESEDLTQETFLRAWRKRTSFEGRSTLRAWLYRIATNACLDALARRPRPVTQDSEISWLQPYPDRLLEEIPATDDEPAAAVVSKETVELAFLAAIQHLSAKQRAVLILRDVLGWSAKHAHSLDLAGQVEVEPARQVRGKRRAGPQSVIEVACRLLADEVGSRGRADRLARPVAAVEDALNVHGFGSSRALARKSSRRGRGRRGGRRSSQPPRGFRPPP